MRVNTHAANKKFKFKKWEDHSPPPNTIHFLSVLLLTRLWTHKTIKYSAYSWKKFQKKKRKFIRKNNRDVHYDYWCTEDIPYHVERMLVYNDQVGAKPWFANYCTLLIMDVFLVGWILRWKLNSNSKIVEYDLVKYIKH